MLLQNNFKLFTIDTPLFLLKRKIYDYFLLTRIVFEF